MTGAHRPSPLSTWSKSRYAQISRLLDESLGLSPPARAAWLEALERQEPALATDLRDLLEPAESRAAGILAAAEDLGDRLAALPATEQSLVGRLFGPYRVRTLLGQGGMGSVWLAERVDGLFARCVALKLVHPALMGLGLAERLSRERTILAVLDHPNIARLYDAGLAEDGQPYLALEYVPGSPFGVYCDRRQPPRRTAPLASGTQRRANSSSSSADTAGMMPQVAQIYERTRREYR
jgi:serine/threonine-protein kinase